MYRIFIGGWLLEKKIKMEVQEEKNDKEGRTKEKIASKTRWNVLKSFWAINAKISLESEGYSYNFKNHNLAPDILERDVFKVHQTAGGEPSG